MFRLIRPRDFLAAVSRSPRLKFILAWITIGGLVIPSAFLMSFGFPEKYVLPGMLAVIPLFQYVVLCIFPALNCNDGIGDGKVIARAFPAFLSDAVVVYPTVEVRPGGCRFVVAEAGVGKTTVLTDAMRQARDSSTLSLLGPNRKTMIVFDEAHLSLDVVGTFLKEAEKKNRDKIIELQRKSLVASQEEATLPARMLLLSIPQHG